MSINITLDSIIRRNLAKRKLPLHYYSPVLVIAKEGLDEMHFDALQKVKVATIAIDPILFTGTLPVDFSEAVAVGVETGDKVKPIGYNHRLNVKDDGGVAYSQQPDTYSFATGPFVGGILLENVFNQFLNFNGRFFGRPVTWADGYSILRDLGKIRLNNKSTVTSVQLVYISMPEKVSSKSVIHPFAKKALDSYINWQWAFYNSDKDQELRRRDFYNDYRILRGRLNKMSTTEIKRVVRNKFGLAVKN